MDGVHEPFVGQIRAMSISARLWRLTKSKANQSSYARHSTSDQASLVVTGAVMATDFAACCPFTAPCRPFAGRSVDYMT